MNLTTTLLVVSFTYIILTSPSTILVLGWNYFGITSGHSAESVKLCRSVAKMFLNMNNALNFIQYACTGQKFRTASKDLIHHTWNNITKICLSSRCKNGPSGTTIDMNVISKSDNSR